MSFSYDKFLRPITSSDRYIQILDNTGKVEYTINSFSILNVFVNNNLLKINLKSGRAIEIPFISQNESKLAISRIQEQIDILTQKIPINIEKDVENYIVSQSDVKVISSSPIAATASSLTYDYELGSVWYHGTASTDYTAKFVNIPTIDNRSVSAKIIISQGATAYAPTVVHINGVTQSIKWNSGTYSTGTYSVSPNQINVVEFTFIRTSATFSHVLAQINKFASL
jgi:hypothetical protein